MFLEVAHQLDNVIPSVFLLCHSPFIKITAGTVHFDHAFIVPSVGWPL